MYRKYFINMEEINVLSENYLKKLKHLEYMAKTNMYIKTFDDLWL